MRPPFVVLSIVVVLLLGAVPIFFGTGFLLIDELNNYRYTKHALNSPAVFFFIVFPMSFALLAVVTSIGLVQLRAWARKLLIFLATVPVLGCTMLVLLRPKWIFPPSQPFSQNAILVPDNALGFQLYVIMLCILAPVSIWWLTVARRRSFRAFFH